MKFNDSKGFFFHLKNTSFDQLCKVYLIIVTDDYERSQVINYSKHFFLKEGVSSTKFDGQDLSYQKIHEESDSLSLFSQTPLFIIDNIHKLKDLKSFSKLVENFKDGFFLLAAPSLKGIELLNKIVEKHGAIFDLSKEKPWERTDRIEKMLFSKTKMKKVELTLLAHKRLIEKVGYNVSLLDQELQKLILYTYDKKKIDIEDVEEIVLQSAETSTWQMAEEFVFEGKYPILSLEDVHLFINAVRRQLQFGFKMASLIKKNISSHELKSYFPKLWPKLIEKRKSQVQSLPISYFKSSLAYLFDAEIALRDEKISESAILDLFLSKIYHARN